jgi:glycosyltransferase involved in cell wall biosynthesis
MSWPSGWGKLLPPPFFLVYFSINGIISIMFDLALLIPCYNESKRITSTFNAYYNFFSGSKYWQQKKVALVLVDDGSSDDTLKIIKAFENQSVGNIKIIATGYDQNKGKGAAIKYGVSSVDAKLYGFTDADLAYRPELVDDAYNKLTDCDLVIGRRINDSNVSFYSRLRNFISLSLRKFIHSVLSLPNYDTQCGFKFFNRKVAIDVIPQIRQDRFSFDIELILRTLKANFQIRELSISFTHSNESTVTWRDGVRYVLDTISISENLQSVKFRNLIVSLFVVALVVSFTLYGWVIRGGFLFSDDFTWLWHGQKINSFGDILSFRMSTFYSPVMNTFYAIMQRTFGYSPEVFFAIGLVVHSLVALLSGALVWLLKHSRLIALITTTLVAVAGIAYEPLVWIGSNMHSFVALFMLASLVAYSLFLNSNKSRYLIISFVFFVLALGTKESAIVTPALMFLLTVYKYIENKEFLTIKFGLFWLTSLIVSFAYLYRQYLWQKNSIWVESGVWNISIEQVLRIPFILLDNFFPITPLKFYLTEWSAGLLWLFAVMLIMFIAYKFRKIKLVWFGLGWAIICSAPFIFFQTQFWWEPLASRYNYLARIGIIILLASIFHYMVVNNRARYIVNGLVSIVIVSVISQLIFTSYIVRTEYDYVYNTGRSLTSVMQEVAIIKPDKILVRWDYPFTGNNAHIVGAASVIAGVPEEKLIFLKRGESENLDKDEILLYWDAQSRKYSIRNN